MILLGFFLLNTAVVLFLLQRNIAHSKNLPKPEQYSLDPGQLPSVSVIIPARDEEICIGACLESLARQNYPDFEIIVVDDGSTDGTPAIIEELAQRYPRIRAVRNETPPPAGWMGKCYALMQAVPLARGQWFTFVDADTVHKPDMLKHTIACALAKKASMISYWSKHRIGGFGERLMGPAIWGAFEWGDADLKVNDPTSNVAYGIGHCMAVERAAYFAVGGHQAAREWRIDDHALAMLLKYQGYPILMADGRNMLTVRMFTDFESFWLGWAKQLFAIFRFSLGRVLFHIYYVASLMLFPVLELLMLILFSGEAGLSSSLRGDWLFLWGAVIVQFLIVLYWYISLRSLQEGWQWYYFFLLPLTGTILIALDIYAAILVLGGRELTWKGRSYKIGRPTMPPVPEPLIDPLHAG